MNRREFVKCSAGAAGWGMLLPAVLKAQGTSPAPIGTARRDRPNIILFLVDDMGWQDTSVPFHNERTVWNELYHTPHMERLAAQGMKFTDAYAASPVCSPTRVSMMTGKNPARTHITDWVVTASTATAM